MIPFVSPMFGKGRGGEEQPVAANSLAFDYLAGAYRLGTTTYASLAAVPGATFARAGEQGAVRGDGSVAWFAADSPALTDRGLHLYGAVTAYSLHSQAMQNWLSYSGPVVDAVDTIVAPDGSASAETITFGASGAGQLYQGIVGPSGAATISLFAQAEGPPKKFRLKAFVGGADDYGPDLTPATIWQRFMHVRTAASGVHGQISIGNEAAGGTGAIRVWQGQILGGSFPDGGPLVRTATSALTLPASELIVPMANGNYVATYCFDDLSEQAVTVTISDGKFRHAVHGTLQRAIVTQLSMVAA